MSFPGNLECSSLIAGDSLPKASRRVLPIINPANEQTVGLLVCARFEDIGGALKAAESVLPS